MFVPFKRPHTGDHIRLNIDITNHYGVFKAPHAFYVVHTNDEVSELRDSEGNHVFGVPHVDIRDHFELITAAQYYEDFHHEND